VGAQTHFERKIFLSVSLYESVDAEQHLRVTTELRAGAQCAAVICNSSAMQTMLRAELCSDGLIHEAPFCKDKPELARLPVFPVHFVQ